MARLRPVNFEDRLTLVEHLDELRTRIIISVVAFAVAFGLCFWQNSRLLDIANTRCPAPDADHLRRRRAVHHHRDDLRLRGLVISPAGDPLPGLRVRPAGVHHGERRVVVPFLLGVPVLFVAGVVFGYFVVLPAGDKFLLNFNTSQFNIQIRARDYYSFFTLMLA